MSTASPSPLRISEGPGVASAVASRPALVGLGAAVLVGSPAVGVAWLTAAEPVALAAAVILPATAAAAVGLGAAVFRRPTAAPSESTVTRRVQTEDGPADSRVDAPAASGVDEPVPQDRSSDSCGDRPWCAGALTEQAVPPGVSAHLVEPRRERRDAAGAAATAKAAVVIRLADAARGRALADVLAREGYYAVAADTTDELHALLNRDRVDLLVIEDALPGFLSGLDVVEMFRRELLRPQVVMLADAARHGPRLRELRPDASLPPSASLDDVAAAVRTALGRAGRVVPVAPPARRLVAAHSGLKPMPQLLVKLAAYLATDAAEVSIPDLAKDVSADAAAAELLRVTNSSALGLRRRVASVADAVALLGPRKTISLVVSSAAASSANELLRNWSEPLRAWYHRRSVLTAAAAQAFAKFEGVSPDTAFLLGLLQDLGVVVQADAAGDRYARTVERTRSVPQLTLPLVERVELGYTHADVSAALLQRWGLPASLVGPVLAHHGDDAPLTKTEPAFVRLMRIGEAVADLADHQCPQRRQALNRLLSAYPAATPEACRAAVAEAVGRAVEASRMFALPEPDRDALQRLEVELRATQEGT